MSSEFLIAQISVKRSDTDHEILTPQEFIKLSFTERTRLIQQRAVEFIDFNGEKVSLLAGMKELTRIIQKLRETGSLYQTMFKK